MFLQRFPDGSCCLCGSTKKLTGEHKIKASVLRLEFGQQTLVLGAMDSGERRLKPVQSVKSKHFKFGISICEQCNTSRTQPADREFDRFHQMALEKIKAGEDPATVFDLEQYAVGSEPYLNVFRYFAKLLVCHAAEVLAPIPKILAQFATGENSHNRIWLWVRNDPTYRNAAMQFGELSYAAHGGLVVYGDKTIGGPNGFHSMRTVGPLQYVFYLRLTDVEKVELQTGYSNFYEWCVQRVKATKESPIPDEALLQLGLTSHGAERP